MHRVTLRFQPEWEHAFDLEQTEESLPAVRWAVLSAGSVLAALIVLMAAVVPEGPDGRFAMAVLLVPLSANLLLLPGSCLARFGRWRAAAFLAVFALLAATFVHVILVAPTPRNVIAILMGTILSLIYALVFTRIGVLSSNVAAAMVLLTVVPAALLWGELPWSWTVPFAAVVLAAHPPLAAAGYLLERSARQAFVHRHRLRQERAVAHDVLLEALPHLPTA